MELHLALLAQLRAFVAVARHQSFKRAAEHLHVTQSALSHHVRHLEQDLGTQLVERLHRRIELTAAGRTLLDGCATHFDGLAGAVRQVRHAGDTGALTVSVAPYFSAKWLTPRLGRLWSRHPALDLQLRHAYQPADFPQDDVDAGISWGHGRWSGAESVLLLAGTLTPVCSADYRARLAARPRPAALLKHRLFYEFDAAHWRAWFAAAGVNGAFTAVQIDDSHALRRAVLDGHGVGLFFEGLVQEDLRTGQLVQPFKTAVDPGAGYYLVRPRGRPVSSRLGEFMQWILDEARQEPFA
ncbi:LysR substrate-binding domain-containing protein [Ramlibacter sp.]|uniref:LysR substrate-binding domain-containing protein n=1 Tax=Ramlibacter sp. TaxID=1917967 RepID=UPI0017D4EAF3|nr:LysR substrate-binding domain-containing protein [Ramlibacter sp.]MBA2675914.1 LysR family transcriptional regulator [Ramlibacter sp.]